MPKWGHMGSPRCRAELGGCMVAVGSGGRVTDTGDTSVSGSVYIAGSEEHRSANLYRQSDQGRQGVATVAPRGPCCCTAVTCHVRPRVNAPCTL